MEDKITLLKNGEKWLPISVGSLDEHFRCLLKINDHVLDVHGQVKNLSYSLQQIEFLHKVLCGINLTSALYVQNIKTILILGSGVIESIFYYLIKSNDKINKTDWLEIHRLKSNEFTIESSKLMHETIVFKKVDKAQYLQPTFDQLAKKIEGSKLLGAEFEHYSKISALRKLRNKIHIHNVQDSMDTDWNNFGKDEFRLINILTYSILTSTHLFPESRIKKRFNFLLYNYD